jgi:hypothetical protein
MKHLDLFFLLASFTDSSVAVAVLETTSVFELNARRRYLTTGKGSQVGMSSERFLQRITIVVDVDMDVSVIVAVQ